ncbi:gamma-interferon-inducible lysosomal thiol reductase-like isoform X1 [Macrobrachium nipponense]|uniref:gamma-interferon-inducible lysosomal thiol reductase-like isoform X1 n=1 Tax=Macrobrachium nipponense TaxID=159736 RepID=UPI0030C811E7
MFTKFWSRLSLKTGNDKKSVKEEPRAEHWSHPDERIVLLELPVRTQATHRKENGVGRVAWGVWSSYLKPDSYSNGKRSSVDAWTTVLVSLVLTLVLINDMNTYGKVRPRWANSTNSIYFNASDLVSQEVEVNPPMNVAVYYEALCPDSRHFVMKQLTPAYKKLKDIIELHLVPYGKASTLEKNGKFTFDCQHGPVECQANMVHACVTNIVKDQTKQLSIVHCMIDKNMQPLVAGQKCVESHKERWVDVENCVNSDQGASILKHMGDMTHNLKPKVSFIPTITIDGSQDDQKHVLQDFHKVLCRRFKGPKQPSC